MKSLYVAGQNAETREWVPVAELRKVKDGFQLRYTQGARRLPGFVGLSRMSDLEKTYFSESLFPFFSNRLIPKSRPEFKSYLDWLGLDATSESPLDVLAVSAGVRATDQFEIFVMPNTSEKEFDFDFFPRGLRYQVGAVQSEIAHLASGDEVFLMKDFQNAKDRNALAIRTEKPSALLIGYVPRYYAPALQRLLTIDENSLQASIKRINPDAPQDMRILVTLHVRLPSGFDFLADSTDFVLLSGSQGTDLKVNLIQETNLDF
jgi:hypothetical protein